MHDIEKISKLLSEEGGRPYLVGQILLARCTSVQRGKINLHTNFGHIFYG